MRFITLVAAAICILGSIHSTNAQPTVKWVRTCLGPNPDIVSDMSISRQGDIRIVGGFSDSIVIGGGLATTARNGEEGFMARFSSAGNPVGLTGVLGTFLEEASTHVVDAEGNVYLTGTFDGYAEVGQAEIESPYEDQQDVFLVKFNRFGVVQWYKTFVSADKSELPPLTAIDSSGVLYLAFSFGDILQLPNGQNLTSLGGFDVVVLKMDAAGNIIWVVQQGNEKDDVAQSISVTPTGDRILVTQQFEGTESFDNKTFESFSGKEDMAVRALNANGQQQWAFRVGANGVDRKMISTATKDKFYLSGEIHGLTMFNTQQINSLGESSPDFYICRVSKEGAIEYLKQYGGINTESANDIHVDEKGAIYIAGYFNSTGQFSDGDLLEAEGGEDGFLARYRADGSFDWVMQFAGPYADQVRGIVLGADNSPYVTGMFDTRMTVGDTTIQGQRSDDVFVAGFICGPNTQLTPKLDRIEVCQFQDSLISARNGSITYEWSNGETALPTQNRSFFNTKDLPVGTHNISVTITDEYGCTGKSKTITVVIREPAPLPTATYNPNTKILTCDVDNVTYLWYKDGVAIAGATAKTHNATGQNGKFKVLITDANGCKRFSEEIQVGETSITELDGAVGIYPNPFSGTLTVLGWEGANVSFISLLGQTVLSVESVSNAQQISTESLAPGAYTILIQLPGRAVTFSTVKQ